MIKLVYDILWRKFPKDSFFILLIIIHLFFFIYKIVSNNYLIIPDSNEYYFLAENIYKYLEFYCGDLNVTINPEYYTRRPPLYSIFILLFSFFLKSKITIVLIQGFLSIAGISIIKSVFEKIYGKPNRFFLFLFVFSSLSQFIYANMIMSEVFVQFLIVMTVYITNKFIESGHFRLLLSYQFLIVLLLLTKPVFYIFIIPNILITYLLCKSQNIKSGIFTSIIPIVIVFLYCQWNYERTGSYNFSSIQHVNLRNYNLKYFQTYKYGAEYAQNVNDSIRVATDNTKGYSNKIKVINSMSSNYILKDIGSYFVFHAVGIPKFFVDPGRFDLFTFFNLDQSKINEVGLLRHLNEGGIKGAFEFLKSQPPIIIILFHGILLINLFKFLGFVWFLFKLLKKSPLLIWITLIFVIYIAGITGPVGAARFTIPILPLYLFLSLYGISDLLKTIKNYWAKTSLTSPSS